MVDSESDKNKFETLKLLARTLNIPVENFFDVDPSEGRRSETEQETEILQLFRKISDPCIRMQCIVLMRRISGE